MNKGKLAVAVIGALGLYFVAAGGMSALERTDLLSVLAEPVSRGNPLDAVLAMTAVVLLTFAALPSDHGLGRTTILSGVALACAVITTVCGACIIALAHEPRSELVGALALVMVTQAFLGLAASTLLFTRREDRHAATVPLLVNISLVAVSVSLFLVPVL